MSKKHNHVPGRGARMIKPSTIQQVVLECHKWVSMLQCANATLSLLSTSSDRLCKVIKALSRVKPLTTVCLSWGASINKPRMSSQVVL
jgi:hypothetical protein